MGEIQKRIFLKTSFLFFSILTSSHIFITMETKVCSCCRKLLEIINFYPNKRYTDGYNCYCKVCVIQNTKKSQLKHKTEWFMQDGFMYEKDHFNAALEQYAQVFNLPSLLKYRKK